MRLSILYLLGACSVDRGGLDDQVFRCETDSDCASGYGCQPADVGGSGHCARLGEPCDGYLTEAGRCVETCTIESPDSAVGCPVGLSCVRTDLLGNAGVCLATTACNTSDDCAGTERETCLAELLAATFQGDVDVVAKTDHSVCVRSGCSAPNELCAANEICLTNVIAELGVDICVPRCTSGVPDACPPGFGCFSQQAPGGGRVCLPGVSGTTCAEDLDCLIGSCKEVTDQGHRQCAVPCELEGGLAACSSYATTPRGVFILNHCVERDGEELCVVFGNYFWECGESAAWQPCMEGVGCIEPTDQDGNPTGREYCIDECSEEDRCPPAAYCGPIAGSDMLGCTEQKAPGKPCRSDDECISGSCVQGGDGTCDAPTRCCTVPESGP